MTGVVTRQMFVHTMKECGGGDSTTEYNQFSVWAREPSRLTAMGIFRCYCVATNTLTRACRPKINFVQFDMHLRPYLAGFNYGDRNRAHDVHLFTRTYGGASPLWRRPSVIKSTWMRNFLLVTSEELDVGKNAAHRRKVREFLNCGHEVPGRGGTSVLYMAWMMVALV